MLASRWRHGAGLKIVAMTTDGLLTLRLDPNTGGQVIAGWICDERGEHYFTGWLGLLTLLEQARAKVAAEQEVGADNDDA
jgi:hypothetical protein